MIIRKIGSFKKQGRKDRRKERKKKRKSDEHASRYTHLIPVFRRQWKADICEFKASLDYLVSVRKAS